jgi:hypothetical protein
MMDLLKLVEEYERDKNRKEPEDTMSDSRYRVETPEFKKGVSSKNGNSKDTSLLKKVVKLLNEGSGFSELEKSFTMKRVEIKALLSRNGFRYNHLFDIWTNQPEEEILLILNKELLTKGITLLEYSKSNKINFIELSTRMNKVIGVEHDRFTIESSTTAAECRLEESPYSPKTSNSTTTTSADHSTYQSETIIELPIFLNKEIFRMLNEESFKQDTSVSSLIISIVLDHFKKQRPIK